MRKVALLILKYSIFFWLPFGETWSIDENVGSVKEQPIDEVNLHLSPYSGRIRQPWIFIPGLPDRLPICYNGSSEHLENIVRLSQVLCRHSGYMIATKWIPILGDTGGIFRRGLVANAYCRGDEQLIEHCQWHQPIYNMCNEFLALECDDCSRTYHLKEDSEITLTSPGFPFYIPLVTCEWNVTLMPEHNLVIRFQQFDLPSPDYDETIDGISCRSGSLDILPYRADINRITLDGRFCGHHSPGNVTIFSNRVLIRFIAGNYKLDVISKKGFAAEFLIVPASSITNSTIITRWVLIGCAVFLSAVFIISFWFCKQKLTQFRQFCCCRVDPVNVSNSDIGQQMAFSSTNNCSPIRMSRAQQPSHFTSYNNRRDTKGCAIEASDLLHRQQTQQLEKWQSTRTGTSGGTVVKAVEIPEFTLKDDSHIYEDIEVASDEGNENSVYLNLSD